MINPKEIMICGHPRSGNNYLAALLSINFFEMPWIKFPSTHKLWSDKWFQENSDMRFIYIYRNFTDVALSVYRIQNLFSLDVSSFEEFVSTAYINMRQKEKKKKEFYCVVQRGNERKIRKGPGKNCLASVAERPGDWHRRHVNVFAAAAFSYPKKIHMVSYDMLQINFQFEMSRLGFWLEGKKHEAPYIDIKEKVGFFIEGLKQNGT